MIGSQTLLKTRSLMPRLARVALMMAAVLILGAVLIISTRGTVPTAFAVTITVDDLADTAHFNDTNGNGARDGVELASTVCDTVAGDPVVCTLRAALYVASNNGDTADTINFDGSLSGSLDDLGATLALGPCLTDLSNCGANGVVDNTTIDGPTASPDPVITIDCGATAVGFTVTGADNTIRDLNIVDCGTAAILITDDTADGNEVLGNYIGTNITGTACTLDGFNTDGVQIAGSADNNQIGDGTTTTDRNVISCNTSDGVEISGVGTSGNLVENNYIGTNDTGTADLGNTVNGVSDTSSSNNDIVNNVISGNNADGINTSSSGGTISGNMIGTNAAGTGAIGNGQSGVELAGASGYTVGGTTVADRNLISGNNVGVFFSGSSSTNTAEGNYIGTDVSGNVALANNLSGVIDESTTFNTIRKNVISGNSQDGIRLTGDGSTTVENNNIGIGADGSTPVGNTLMGVRIDNDSDSNVIGGAATGSPGINGSSQGNIIAYNGDDGIQVVDPGSDFNSFRLNSIFLNIGDPIILVDAMSNEGIDAPTISAISFNPGSPATHTVSVTGTVLEHPSGSTVDLYRADAQGEPKTYLATANIFNDGATATGSVTVCGLAPGDDVVGIATDPSKNSSEVSPAVAAGVGTSDCAPLGEATATPIPTNTPPPTNTFTPTNTSTPTLTITPTLTPTVTPTPTETVMVDATATDSPTDTPTNTPTNTATNTPTNTPTNTATNTPTIESPPPITFGDVNKNGEVNVIDAALILQDVAGIITLAFPENADVNQDGTVNVIDAALIFQFIVRRITSLPV